MGRYYVNPDPDFVKPEEFLFKPPWEEIKAGLKFMDETIQESEAKEDAITDTLNSVKYNAESSADKALYEDMYGQYRGAVDELQNKVVENPNDWRGQVTRIRRLSNNLKEDLTKGTFAKMQKRKADLDAFDATYKTTLDPTVYNKAREYYINQMNEGLDSGNYDTEFSKEAVMNKRDLNKEFMGYLSQKLGLPNEQSINGYGENGQFMYTKNGSTTSISRESIEKMYKDFLGADAKPYLEYMNKIGVGDYMKDGDINMENRELKAGMEFMGGYNYSQTKMNVTADYSLGAKEASANRQAAFESGLRIQENAIKASQDAKAAAETARAEALASGTIEPNYITGATPLADLSSSLFREINTGINNNPNLTPQARQKANHALIQSLVEAGTGSVNINNLMKTDSATQQKILQKLFKNMNPQQSRRFTENFNNKIASLPSLKDLAGTSLNALQRADRNFQVSQNKTIKFSVGNTAALLGYGNNDHLIIEKNKDTRSKYSSVGDVMDKKVRIVEAGTGKLMDFKKNATLGQLYTPPTKDDGTVPEGTMSERIGAGFNDKNGFNLKEGTWVANGLYPAGDSRNANYMIPGTYKGRKVLIMVENGPGGITFGPTR